MRTFQMKSYLNLGYKLIASGDRVETRTGPTRSLTGQSLSFDLSEGFPLLTSKYINFNHIKHEGIWYLMGTDSIKYLKDHNIHIWDAWASPEDSIGPTYGYQWRNFNNDSDNGDQFRAVVSMLRTDRSTRRAIINGWNPLQLAEMALPPCIVNLHFIPRGSIDANTTQLLDLVVYQRSADFCLGVPYDIAEMALLLHIMSELAGYTPGKLTVMYGDLHIYENHIQTFLTEQASNPTHLLPTLANLSITPINEYFDIKCDLINYIHGPRIRYELAV